MNDIVSFLALAGLSVLALAAIGAMACPQPERLPVRQLSRADWGDLIRTGVRVVATWGPRDPYADRGDAGATPAPSRPGSTPPDEAPTAGTAYPRVCRASDLRAVEVGVRAARRGPALPLVVRALGL
ncbi:MAG: hypothetical protein ACR2FV_13960 [Ornithinimicrobium sp.]